MLLVIRSDTMRIGIFPEPFLVVADGGLGIRSAQMLASSPFLASAASTLTLQESILPSNIALKRIFAQDWFLSANNNLPAQLQDGYDDFSFAFALLYQRTRLWLGYRHKFYKLVLTTVCHRLLILICYTVE